MTLYFLVLISVWGISSSDGTMIEHADAKKIGTFKVYGDCLVAKNAITPGLRNGEQAHCIGYLLKEHGKP